MKKKFNAMWSAAVMVALGLTVTNCGKDEIKKEILPGYWCGESLSVYNSKTDKVDTTKLVGTFLHFNKTHVDAQSTMPLLAKTSFNKTDGRYEISKNVIKIVGEKDFSRSITVRSLNKKTLKFDVLFGATYIFTKKSSCSDLEGTPMKSALKSTPAVAKAFDADINAHKAKIEKSAAIKEAKEVDLPTAEERLQKLNEDAGIEYCENDCAVEGKRLDDELAAEAEAAAKELENAENTDLNMKSAKELLKNLEEGDKAEDLENKAADTVEKVKTEATDKVEEILPILEAPKANAEPLLSDEMDQIIEDSTRLFNNAPCNDVWDACPYAALLEAPEAKVEPAPVVEPAPATDEIKVEGPVKQPAAFQEAQDKVSTLFNNVSTFLKGGPDAAE